MFYFHRKSSVDVEEHLDAKNYFACEGHSSRELDSICTEMPVAELISTQKTDAEDISINQAMEMEATSDLSEYEQLRERNIETNKRMLLLFYPAGSSLVYGE